MTLSSYFFVGFFRLKWSEFVSSFDGVRKDSRIWRDGALLGLLIDWNRSKLAQLLIGDFTTACSVSLPASALS